MSKNFKNLIMIILIVIGLICIYFTTTIALENKKIVVDEKKLNKSNQIQDDIRNEEPPEKPNDKNDFQTDFNGANKSDFKPNDERNIKSEFRIPSENFKLDRKYIILFSVESLIVSLLLSYLIMSKFNEKNLKEVLENSDKIVIYILLTIVIVGFLFTIESYLIKQENDIYKMPPNETEKSQKETTADDVESGKNVVERNINLNNYSSNITLTDGGEYTITGNFEYSILINSDEEVTLNLDNVNINNELTATIANISTNALIINLNENTTNVLSDGGSSEYDACIYSAGPLTISGNGKLEVYGSQEEGEGIATETNNITIDGGNIYVESNDDGINAGGDGGTITINNGTILIKASGDGIDSNKDLVINGGTIYTIGSPTGGDAGIDTDAGFCINGGLVIALGSDMLEKPNSNSEQNSLCFTLDNVVENGTLITLMNENEEIIVSFEAMESFRTLIISSELLINGKYYLYKDGNNTGKLENEIYYDGDYTKGEEVSIKEI